MEYVQDLWRRFEAGGRQAGSGEGEAYVLCQLNFPVAGLTVAEVVLRRRERATQCGSVQ
jgi:hypothetical protein